MCVIWKKTYYFHFNSWLSFQQLCRLLRDKLFQGSDNIKHNDEKIILIGYSTAEGG